MDYSKLIHEYLDGELNTPLEDALFAGLSANTELRTEFSQQIKLHIVAQNDMGTISPPAESTNKIFSSLGFSIPTGAYLNRIANVSGTIRKSSPLALFFKKHLATIATALISILMTSLVYNTFITNKNNNNIDNQLDISRIPITQSFDANNYYYNYDNNAKSFNISSQNPPSNRISNLNTIRNANRSIKNTLADNIKEINNQSNILNSNSEQSIINKDENKISNSLNLSNISMLSDNNSIIKYNQEATSDNDNLKLSINDFGNKIIQKNNSYAFLNPNNSQNIVISPDNTKFSLQMRGFQYPYAKSEIKASDQPFFNNMSISAFYKFNTEHSLGLEFGQEQFVQKFINNDRGQAFEYEQNPLFFWYGASYRWTINDLNIADIIYPFSQVFAGITHDAVSGKIVGPLGRMQVGLQLKLINNLTFSFGIEGTMLLYSIHNQLSSSEKIGLTYGISLNY